ncbi:MAG TPA: hypothetical protein VGG84_17970 [Gemmatimonadaceae bacterium]
MPSRLQLRRLRSPTVRALLLMLGAAGCSRAPDARQVLDGVRSWTATVRFAADELRSGATTAAYSAEIRDAARRALAASPRQLGDRPVPADTAEQMRSATDSLATALRLLDAELAAR